MNNMHGYLNGLMMLPTADNYAKLLAETRPIHYTSVVIWSNLWLVLDLTLFGVVFSTVTPPLPSPYPAVLAMHALLFAAFLLTFGAIRWVFKGNALYVEHAFLTSLWQSPAAVVLTSLFLLPVMNLAPITFSCLSLPLFGVLFYMQKVTTAALYRDVLVEFDQHDTEASSDTPVVSYDEARVQRARSASKLILITLFILFGLCGGIAVATFSFLTEVLRGIGFIP